MKYLNQEKNLSSIGYGLLTGCTVLVVWVIASYLYDGLGQPTSSVLLGILAGASFGIVYGVLHYRSS